jgi:hypothetical protein
MARISRVAMKRPNAWLWIAVGCFAPLILAASLAAAVPARKVRLAYSAFAYANPPFWIAHDLKLFEIKFDPVSSLRFLHGDVAAAHVAL